jgi:hypothetical protein
MLMTTWEATFEGHEIRVVRNRVTRGFEARFAGRKVGGELFSLMRCSSAVTQIDLDGRSVRVEVRIVSGRECNVWIDGAWVKMVRQRTS